MAEMIWPKWTTQYEDIKENNKVMRMLTSSDRAFDWFTYITHGVSATVRTLLRKVRDKLKENL